MVDDVPSRSRDRLDRLGALAVLQGPAVGPHIGARLLAAGRRGKRNRGPTAPAAKAWSSVAISGGA